MSDSLPKQSTPKSKIYLTGLSEPMSLNELVADDKNITLKGKLIVPGKHKPVTVQRAIEEKLLDIDNSTVLDPKRLRRL
jgi:hypothetical protein